jgi:hypothetical protein
MLLLGQLEPILFMYDNKVVRFSIGYDYITTKALASMPVSTTNANQSRLLLLYLQAEQERIRIVMIMADLTDQVAR